MAAPAPNPSKSKTIPAPPPPALAPTRAPARPAVSRAPERLASAPVKPAPEPDISRGLLLAVMRRIEGYIDEETSALKKATIYDFKASNDRKSQGLVDFNQAVRRLRKSDYDRDLQDRVLAFRSKLAGNLKLIQIHLQAVKEISDALSDAIRSAESDGTYSRSINPYRNAP